MFLIGGKNGLGAFDWTLQQNVSSRANKKKHVDGTQCQNVSHIWIFSSFQSEHERGAEIQLANDQVLVRFSLNVAFDTNSKTVNGWGEIYQHYTLHDAIWFYNLCKRFKQQSFPRQHGIELFIHTSELLVTLCAGSIFASILIQVGCIGFLQEWLNSSSSISNPNWFATGDWSRWRLLYFQFEKEIELSIINRIIELSGFRDILISGFEWIKMRSDCFKPNCQATKLPNPINWHCMCQNSFALLPSHRLGKLQLTDIPRDASSEKVVHTQLSTIQMWITMNPCIDHSPII